MSLKIAYLNLLMKHHWKLLFYFPSDTMQIFSILSDDMPVTNTYLIEGWQAGSGKKALQNIYIFCTERKRTCLIREVEAQKMIGVGEEMRVAGDFHFHGPKNLVFEGKLRLMFMCFSPFL